MNSGFLSSVAVLTLWTVSLKPLSSAQSNFSSFDFPGATDTQATGIALSGDSPVIGSQERSHWLQPNHHSRIVILAPKSMTRRNIC